MGSSIDDDSLIGLLKQAVVDHMQSLYNADARCVVGKWKPDDDDVSVILGRPQRMDNSKTTRQQLVPSAICTLNSPKPGPVWILFEIYHNVHSRNRCA